MKHKAPDERQRFWLNRDWPLNPLGYVFLAQAFHEIGRARFGEAWTGFEPYQPSDLISMGPSLSDAFKKADEDRTDQERALLRKFAADKAERDKDPEVYDARRKEIEAVSARERARESSASTSRAFLVQKEIIQRCESGDLISALRPVRGGAMQPIPAHCWNGVNATNRFYLCQMSLRDPFGAGFAGASFGHIFIEKSSLDRFLLSQPFAAKPAGLDIHLSPYLQVLVTVARKMQITPENQPKKEAIVEEIKAAWTGDPDLLKDTLAGYMATILREPESQLGRGKKRNP